MQNGARSPQFLRVVESSLGANLPGEGSSQITWFGEGARLRPPFGPRPRQGFQTPVTSDY